MSKANYNIGIDLGTTNCTMAYREIKEEAPILQFAIPQIISAGNEKENLSLPSFLYFPLSEELEAKIAGISWDPSRPFCLGSFAQDRGKELPQRLISSAKSWLCHSGIDRRESLLPIDAEENIDKKSPLDACSHLLSHLKEAWNSLMDVPFEDQQILITVPASFDPSARQLVQEAAEMAGFPEIILLEEPQAAFYAWLHAHENDWRQNLTVGDTILVVDIGGGTTDFSLITVKDENGELCLHRLAVGEHLLLGGDNIDLSLAYLAKKKLEDQGHEINEWQMQALIHACRKAKENLMSENPPKHTDITIPGRGSRLIGGSLKTQLDLSEVSSLIIDGFVPLVTPQERSHLEKRLGIQQLGLPYALDARISCQLAKFLSMTGENESPTMENFIVPTAVLFNGGTMKASALRERLKTLLDNWAEILGKPSVEELPGADYDFAVSRGAVYYGVARSGQAIRIKSGTSRSYFVGVEDAAPAVPGLMTPLKGICIAPLGMEEGTEQKLESQEFALVIGEPATFRFFSHATPKLLNGVEPSMGTIVKNWKQELTELHPIETHLDKKEGDGKTIRVKIQSKVTELGVLEVWCVASDERKWKLEFDIRKEEVLV